MLEEGTRKEVIEGLEKRLRYESMVTYHTLHHLDERTDRQTRFLLSIDATAYSVSASPTSHRLVDLCHFLNRIFISVSPRESDSPLNLGDFCETAQVVSVCSLLELCLSGL